MLCTLFGLPAAMLGVCGVHTLCVCKRACAHAAGRQAAAHVWQACVCAALPGTRCVLCWTRLRAVCCGGTAASGVAGVPPPPPPTAPPFPPPTPLPPSGALAPTGQVTAPEDYARSTLHSRIYGELRDLIDQHAYLTVSGYQIPTCNGRMQTQLMLASLYAGAGAVACMHALQCARPTCECRLLATRAAAHSPKGWPWWWGVPHRYLHRYMSYLWNTC